MNTNKKLDNKGFSLVELIIVIAIMAILVGVVGTQVIPYIEKSRQSKDLQVLSGFCTDVTSAGSNAAAQLDSSKNYKITITIATGAIAVTGGTATEQGVLENEFKSLSGLSGSSKLNFESKAAKDSAVTTVSLYYVQNLSDTTITLPTWITATGSYAVLDGQSKIAAVSSK